MINICYESTSKCLLSCPYCISSDNGNLIKDNYEKIIEFIGKVHPNRIVIGGGEPFLDPLLKEKIKMIKEEYKKYSIEPYISISTSGACNIDYDTWLFLTENIQCFDISIPSLNNDTYKFIRGKDLLKQAIINTKLAVSYGLNVRISTVVTKYNKNELKDILTFAKKENVNSVRVGRYFPFRNAYYIKDDFELEEKETLKIINDIKNGIYDSIYDKKIIPPIENLNMMDAYLNIDFNGNIFIATTKGKKIIGNINDVDINSLNNELNQKQEKIFKKAKEIIIK